MLVNIYTILLTQAVPVKDLELWDKTFKLKIGVEVFNAFFS